MEFLKSLKVAKRVGWSDLSRVKTEAQEILEVLRTGFKVGNYKRGIAISHNQVSDNPLKFFVLDDAPAKDLGYQVIINPEIRHFGEPMLSSYEGCLTYKFRQEKRVSRFGSVVVKFYVPFLRYFMRPVYKRLEGIFAVLFQHEVQHLKEGRTIYD